MKDQNQQVRIDLAAAYRLIHRLGLDDSIYTHISVRLPGRHDRFLINPYGMRFEEVTASNLVTVDLDGKVVDDPLGLGINPAGFTIHSAVHAARTTRCACCTPTPSPASRCPARSRGCCRSINGRCSSPIASPITTTKASRSISIERARLVADLGDKFVMVLRNHGMLTCGRSVAEAFKLMHNLERSCRAQLAIQAANAEIAPLSPAVARKTAGQYASFYDKIELKGEPDTEWAAFKRMLERTDPDFVN